METLHVVLVCDRELDSEGSWALCEKIQPEMEKPLSSVADGTGKRPRTTYCLTGELMSERLDDAFESIEGGHEVGIPSHLPGAHRPRPRYDGRYAYRFDERDTINQDAVAGSLREVEIALGLPSPQTHVNRKFTLQRATTEPVIAKDSPSTLRCCWTSEAPTRRLEIAVSPTTLDGPRLTRIVQIPTTAGHPAVRQLSSYRGATISAEVTWLGSLPTYEKVVPETASEAFFRASGIIPSWLSSAGQMAHWPTPRSC